MTATIEKMPEVVQIRKCENFPFKNYVFPETELSEDLPKSGKNKSIYALYNVEMPNIALYGIPFQHRISDPFHGAESAILPETYSSINDLPNENIIVFPKQQNEQEEIEEAFLRGVQPINHQHKVLFTEEIEIRTSELRRWRPNIVIDPILFDNDE
jgi:hypothetical protein